MATHEEIVDRWVDYQLGKATRLLSPSRASIVADEDVIYSYGTHFPMAKLIRPTDGGDPFWLLNGDRWGMATLRHQNLVRNSVARTGLSSMIVPFTALRSAGIVHDTIRPKVVQDDQVVTIPMKSNNIDDVPAHQQPRFRDYRDDGEFVEKGWDWSVNPPAPRERRWSWEPGPYEWKRYEHLLGESVFVADVRLNDRLGRPVVRSDVAFYSGFDHAEPHGSHYFLCELPVRHVFGINTLEDALETLKPDEVKDAEARGMDVVRQGDLFAYEAITNDVTDRELEKRGWTVNRSTGRGFADRPRLFDTRHAATRVAIQPRDWNSDEKVYARGTLVHVGGEHRPKKLGDGKTWYKIVPNLVPHDAVSTGRRAWSIAARGGLAVD